MSVDPREIRERDERNMMRIALAFIPIALIILGASYD